MTRKVGIPGCGLPQENSILKKTNDSTVTPKYGNPHDTTSTHSSVTPTEQRDSKHNDHFVPGGVNSFIDADSNQTEGNAAIPKGTSIHNKQNYIASDRAGLEKSFIPSGRGVGYDQRNNFASSPREIDPNTTKAGKKVNSRTSDTATKVDYGVRNIAPKADYGVSKTSTKVNPDVSNISTKVKNDVSKTARNVKPGMAEGATNTNPDVAISATKGNPEVIKTTRIVKPVMTDGDAKVNPDVGNSARKVTHNVRNVDIKATPNVVKTVRTVRTVKPVMAEGTTNVNPGVTKSSTKVNPDVGNSATKVNHVVVKTTRNVKPGMTDDHTNVNNDMTKAATKGHSIVSKSSTKVDPDSTVNHGVIKKTRIVKPVMAEGAAKVDPNMDISSRKVYHNVSNADAKVTPYVVKTVRTVKPKMEEGATIVTPGVGNSAKTVNSTVIKATRNIKTVMTDSAPKVNPNMNETGRNIDPNVEKNTKDDSKLSRNVPHKKQDPSTLNSKINGSIWFTPPHEMGFDNKQISVSSQREILSKMRNIVNPGSNGTRSAELPQDVDQTKSTKAHALNEPGSHHITPSSVGTGKSIVSPWEMGLNNKSISTSTARELSQKTNISTQNVPKSFTSIESPTTETFYDASSSTPVPTNISTNKGSSNNKTTPSTNGARFSLSAAPWEMGFDNRMLSTSSSRELSDKTNQTTCEVSPRSAASSSSTSSGPLFSQDSRASSRSTRNVSSSGTGAQFSSKSPWEMGFDNTPISTSSAREISTSPNNALKDIPQKSTARYEIKQGDLGITSSKKAKPSHINSSVISSGTGAHFSSKAPWEMGFDNHRLSSSSAREISSKMNKPVTDIPQSSTLAANPSHKLVKESSKAISHPKDKDGLPPGGASGRGLSSPQEMGFDNKPMSSSSMKEIDTSANKSVQDIPQGFSPIVKKSSSMEDKSRNTVSASRGITAPIVSNRDIGTSNAYASPHEGGFDNKQLSTSSSREISSKTNKPGLPPPVANPSAHMSKKNSITPVAIGNPSNFKTRQTVGYDVPFQGISITQLPPPLGIKGMFKSFPELNAFPTRVSNNKQHNSELQEPLESAFMPKAEKRREHRDKGLLQNDSFKSPRTTVGEYNILAKDLNDPRMSANVFGSGLQKERDITGDEHDVSPLETQAPQELGRDISHEDSFKSKGKIVQLDDLQTNSTKTSAPANSNEGEFIGTKPTRDELVSLDSIRDENNRKSMSHGKMDSISPKKSSISSKSPTQSYSTGNQSTQSQDYWKQSRKHSHAKILKGSRRPATEDQIAGKSNDYVELNDPRMRRGSIGSVSYSQEVGNYPSLIDPSVPTYGFNQKQGDVTPLASNEYHISDPLAQESMKGSVLPLESPSSYIYKGERTTYTEDPRLDRLESEEPNDATIRSMKDATPQSYNGNWDGKREDAVPRQPARRKSRASIVLGKFAKAVTKSNI